MHVNRKPASGQTSDWGLRLWILMLLAIVVAWASWGAVSFMRSRASGKQIRYVKTAKGTLAKQVWKKPSYRKFAKWSQVVREARRLKRPIFLDLYANWCLPCKKLERETFSHPSVHPLLDKKYVVVKFNVDKKEGRRLAYRFRVRFYPTTLMLNSDGREIERVIGFYPPRYYKPALVSVVQGNGFYRDLMQRFRRNPKDLEIKLQLASRSILRRYVSQAQRLYRSVWQADKKNTRGFGDRALFGLARSYARGSKYAKATDYLEEYRKLYPKKNDVLREVMRLQMYCYRRRKRYKDQRRVLRQFAQLFPGQSTKFK